MHSDGNEFIFRFNLDFRGKERGSEKDIKREEKRLEANQQHRVSFILWQAKIRLELCDFDTYLRRNEGNIASLFLSWMPIW